MCGRYALTAMPEDVAESMALAFLEAFPPRYNIAPTQPMLIVTAAERPEPGSNQPTRRPLLVRWGFLPAWAEDPKEFPLLINARAETAHDKSSFRAALRHRRVLIPASGFYEWHRPPKESGARPQAYWIRPKQGGIVSFAGLMETWASAEGSELDTAAVLTTGANATLSPIHSRMPVVIAPEDRDRWLDCKTQEPREVMDLMRPAPDDLFEAIPVSDRVNKVTNSHPSLQDPIAPGGSAIPAVKAAPEKGAANKAAPGDQLSLF